MSACQAIEFPFAHGLGSSSRPKPGVSQPAWHSVQRPATWSAVLDVSSDAARWHAAFASHLPGWRLAGPEDPIARATAQVLLTDRAAGELARSMPQLRLVQLLQGRGALRSPGAAEGGRSARPAPWPMGAHVARTQAAHLTRQVVEYIVARVMHYHRGFDVYGLQQSAAAWQPLPVRTADERRVGILGLCEYGMAAGTMLAQLGFRVRGWSHAVSQCQSIEVYRGDAELEAFLRACEILVVLGSTDGTAHPAVGRRLLATLPPGACVVHLAGADQLQPAELGAALQAGQVGHATLDIDADEARTSLRGLAAHPKVTVTPRVACALRPEIGAAQAVRNLLRLQRGEALLDVLAPT